MTSVFQGLSLSRSGGRVGENPGNEVAATPVSHRLAVDHFPQVIEMGTNYRRFNLTIDLILFLRNF